MEDDGGEDAKIVGVPAGDPRFAEVNDLDDLPHHWLAEVENFFARDQALEGMEACTGRWKGAKEACLVVARRWCHDEHLRDAESFGDPTDLLTQVRG